MKSDELAAGRKDRSSGKSDGAVPVWVIALATTLGMQTVASFLDQSLPIIAPLLTASAGLAPERIGNISSLNAAGVVLFLLFGGPILARLGPVRMLQTGAAMAVCGLLAASSGWPPALVAGALVMGVGYGPSPPAGSRILAATAPARHRTLIFSVKQAGAPFGGALAGLVLAPVAAIWRWPAALAVAMSVGVAAAILIAPVRRQLDIERDLHRPIGPKALFDPRNVAAPFVLLRRNPILASLTALAFSFAIVQGSLFSFTITYLTTDRRMPLLEAGFAYAAMQFAGVGARILLGWLADRTGRPAYNLTAQAFVAAGTVIGFGLLPRHVGVASAALAGMGAGFVAVSWNGIFLAEVARLSPLLRVAETTASSTVVVFLGYVIGPSIFSFLVSLTGGYRVSFLFISGQLFLLALVQVWVLFRRHRRE